MKPTLLILAAGMGSRYGSLKQVDPVGVSGETILEYSVYDAISAGFGKVVFVIRRDIEKDFKEIFIKKLQNFVEVDYVFQEIDMVPEGVKVPDDRTKPWGTGHAVLVAASKIKEPFAVINADDFYGADAYRKMASYLVNLSPAETTYSIVGFDLMNTLSDYGSVSRGVCEVDEQAFLVSVTERTKISRSSNGIVYIDPDDRPIPLNEKSIVSMNYWGFTPEIFKQIEDDFQLFITENYNNLKAEFFLPNVVDKLIRNKQACVKVLRSSGKWFGVTYKEDKPVVVEKIKAFVREGIYPEKLWG